VCVRGAEREREYVCLCELVWVRGQAKDHENWPVLICLELNEITALWWCISLCCSVLQCYSWSHEIKCCALQWCVEMCCRVLQCVVVYCICCGLLQYYSWSHDKSDQPFPFPIAVPFIIIYIYIYVCVCVSRSALIIYARSICISQHTLIYISQRSIHNLVYTPTLKLKRDLPLLTKIRENLTHC